MYPLAGFCEACTGCSDGVHGVGGEGSLTGRCWYFVWNWCCSSGLSWHQWHLGGCLTHGLGNYMSCHWDVVVTASLGGSVSVSLGVVGQVFISLCSYGKVGTLSSVRITANSGDRLGETVQNIFCLRSSF